MTSSCSNKRNNTLRKHLPVLLCFAITALAIIKSDELKKAVYEGFLFSFTTLIPTLFPFFILSDLWVSRISDTSDSPVGKIFENIFSINRYAMSIWLSGLIFGFPLAVKGASQLYKEKIICIDEFERLAAISNNPSMAFVIFGIGAGVLCNIKLGILLYLCCVLSSLTVGIIYRNGKKTSPFSCFNSRQTFDIVESIKNAGLNSINISSYIVFFSATIGLINSLIKSKKTTAIFSIFLEVTNAVKGVSHCMSFSPFMRLVLIAFALAFCYYQLLLKRLNR